MIRSSFYKQSPEMFASYNDKFAPAPKAREIDLVVNADFKGISYYSLCKLADELMCVYPMHYIPMIAARDGKKGVMKADELGNFLAFKWAPISA